MKYLKELEKVMKDFIKFDEYRCASHREYDIVKGTLNEWRFTSKYID